MTSYVLLFLLKVALGIVHLLYFHMKLGLLFFSISVNSVIEVLMGVVLNL